MLSCAAHGRFLVLRPWTARLSIRYAAKMNAEPKPEGQILTRSPELMSRADTALLVVDVQTKLISLVPGHERLVWNIRRLIDGARVLGLKVLGSEQYPQGLGPTVPQLAALVGPMPAKLSFSCAGCPEIAQTLDAAGILAEEQIEILLVLVEERRNIANATEHETVGRPALRAAGRRVEHNPEILPGASLVRRTGGADAWQLPIGAAALVGRPLVMVIAVPRPGIVGHDRFHPHAMTWMLGEGDRFATMQLLDARA